MKRIGISQRLDIVTDYREERDVLDTRWSRLLWSLGYLPIMLSNGIEAVPSYLHEMQLDGFVLSGGNDIESASSRDRLEKEVLNYSQQQGLPVLGVCRGMQYINHYQGGQLQAVDGHVACRHRLQWCWLSDFQQEEVNSFHSQAILFDGLGQDLKVIAYSNDGVVEALCHKYLPWFGVMWHPEREEPISGVDKKLIIKLFDGLLI